MNIQRLPRGRRGARRVDDRRVISGIIHMLRTGARSRDCPGAYGPYTTIYNRYHRWSQQGVWFAVFQALTGMSGVWGGWRDRRHPHQGASIGSGGKRGDFAQAIGRSRGGRTTKIHALNDAAGRPRVLRLSAGNVNDGTMATALIEAAGSIGHLLADRAYDSNGLRSWLAERGTLAVIPSTRSRTVPIPHDRDLYRQRNRIERMFCRLKDFRRVATRYDKRARNYDATIHIAAIAAFWIN
ncbi:IS5 family transposase [Devosia sp.]|uniref:IS5 family transposase n=1 Tax=Devosia sp. TaxID=1871048 RepID=UPI002EF6F249